MKNKTKTDEPKLTPTQKAVKAVLADGGCVQWEQDLSVRLPNRISQVEGFGLISKDGRLVRRLSRKVVESCAALGILGVKKLEEPKGAGLRFIVQIGPHRDAPLRQVDKF